MHYPDFSIRISLREISNLVPILRAVSDEDVARLQGALARVYRAFIWQPEYGGQAYNFTLASLKRRLAAVRGQLNIAPAPNTLLDRAVAHKKVAP